MELKFTPLEFETRNGSQNRRCFWQLKFTPLEFETHRLAHKFHLGKLLKFTPLEFETFLALFLLRQRVY